MISHIIIWSPTAHITYLEVLDYLQQNWTIREIEAFINRTEQVIEYINQNPAYYPYSKESDTYKCIIVGQVSLFYRLNQQKIELLRFWDNRQNPAKLSL
ncbi:MAG: hypothetical protein EOP47_03065 [Sphingobacteriaceae bacterium]|nr:MAG: hypothetical protein EOP47_03065 [Sphingobacteriaceae bacterium]